MDMEIIILSSSTYNTFVKNKEVSPKSQVRRNGPPARPRAAPRPPMGASHSSDDVSVTTYSVDGGSSGARCGSLCTCVHRCLGTVLRCECVGVREFFWMTTGLALLPAAIYTAVGIIFCITVALLPQGVLLLRAAASILLPFTKVPHPCVGM